MNREKLRKVKVFLNGDDEVEQTAYFHQFYKSVGYGISHLNAVIELENGKISIVSIHSIEFIN